jgi:hypothetical protein
MIAGFGRTGAVEADLFGDFSGELTDDTFVLKLVFSFALRAAFALASTHFAQLGSVH